MRRRELLQLVGGTALAWPLAARAQQQAVPVVGYLGSASPGPYAPYVAAFHQGLAETGYADGRNVTMEYRWADARYEQLPALAADLVARHVDVIVTSGGPPAALAAKSATSTIPIVFSSSDPVERGLVTSLARPNGNLTGVSILSADLVPKRLELLAELVPQAKVFALIVNPSNANTEQVIRDVQHAASAKGIQLHILKASTESEIGIAFDTLVQLHAGGLVVGSDPFLDGSRAQLVALAAHHAVPAIYEWRESVLAGGLISYGTSLPGMHRQVGVYTGRILKGAKPADLPVEQPTKFELVINLKTAKALGLTVPQALLARADAVIE
jgi:putative ABC transport system substrate-binding protein